MSMDKKRLYMARYDEPLPTLLCLYPDEEHGTFQYNITMFWHSAWVYAPEFNDILTHRDRFPDFVEVSGAEFERIKNILEAEHNRIEEKKNVIHVEHSKKETAGGIVYIDTYLKDVDRCLFTHEELEKLLGKLIHKDHMTILGIDYSRYDYWGYEKIRSTKNAEDISDVCDMPVEIDGRFMDNEQKYRFRYLSRDKEVKVAQCSKDLDIDLQSVFDDEG